MVSISSFSTEKSSSARGWRWVDLFQSGYSSVQIGGIGFRHHSHDNVGSPSAPPMVLSAVDSATDSEATGALRSRRSSGAGGTAASQQGSAQQDREVTFSWVGSPFSYLFIMVWYAFNKHAIPISNGYTISLFFKPFGSNPRRKSCVNCKFLGCLRGLLCIIVILLCEGRLL